MPPKYYLHAGDTQGSAPPQHPHAGPGPRRNSVVMHHRLCESRRKRRNARWPPLIPSQQRGIKPAPRRSTNMHPPAAGRYVTRARPTARPLRRRRDAGFEGAEAAGSTPRVSASHSRQKCGSRRRWRVARSSVDSSRNDAAQAEQCGVEGPDCGPQSELVAGETSHVIADAKGPTGVSSPLASDSV